MHEGVLTLVWQCIRNFYHRISMLSVFIYIYAKCTSRCAIVNKLD